MGQAKQRGSYEERKEIAIEKKKLAAVFRAQARAKYQERLEQERRARVLNGRARMEGKKVVIGGHSVEVVSGNYHDDVSLLATLQGMPTIAIPGEKVETKSVVIDAAYFDSSQRALEEKKAVDMARDLENSRAELLYLAASSSPV